MSEEEANEVRAKNEEIRKERDLQATKIADKFLATPGERFGWSLCSNRKDRRTAVTEYGMRRGENWMFKIQCGF